MICELLVASEYLRIWPLLDLTCAALALLVRKKSPEEIREAFKLSIPLRPISQAEEERIRDEHLWCDEEWLDNGGTHSNANAANAANAN